MLADQGAYLITVQNAKGSTLKLSGDFFNKENQILQLDLKSQKDREFLLTDIIPKVDVLLESYRPGTMEKLGLSPEVVHTANPKVIYGRLSGYGQVQTKYREREGHDINYLAISGILNKFKRFSKDNAPSPPANLLADFASGSLHLFTQVLQGLYLKKPRTVIDCSLTHSTLYLSQLSLL